MKGFIILAFLFVPIFTFAQTTTEYFSDRFLLKKSTETKAKYIVTTTTYTNGTISKQVTRKGDPTIISFEQYRGEEPIGKWIRYRQNKLVEMDYDFPLIYTEKMDCSSDENTFVPTLQNGIRDPLANFDNLGYIAPIPEFSRQDMTKELVYPDKAIDEGIMGEVWVGFRISEKGEVGDIKVVKGAHILLDKETVRLFRLLKFKEPAFINGEAKAICIMQKLTFKME